VVKADAGPASQWPAILTWRSHDGTRIESARIHLSGNRIKAVGRIVAAQSETTPAFSASYDLVTDDSGATKRLSIEISLAERDRQLSIARDEENMWLVSSFEGESRDAFDGALDVDVMLSPFFNTLPIRRLGLNARAESVTVPVLYVSLPDLSVAASREKYTSAEGAITVKSPAGKAALAVDDNGFVIDYPGLAERI
jgi:hypothetical protein